MIYQIGNMSLNCIREVFRCDADNVSICQDINASSDTCYTLVTIKDHSLAKEIIESYEKAGKKFLATAPHPDGFLILFPYRAERRLSKFYIGTRFSSEECEKICINLIMECMRADMPYPLLYLILDQDQIDLGKDCSVHFGYGLDFSAYDTTIGERECANRCAQIVYSLIEPMAQTKAMSYELMRRKVPKKVYRRFADVFHDVKITTEAEAKSGVLKRAKAFLSRNIGRFFKLFIILCGVLTVIVLLMLLTQLIVGDISFFRLFKNPFKEIGTESMLQ
ncbi:MAG: hypothetical protein K6F44_01925 [Lachnospiraceae bacterium]|nr:hypothetical protein [Lachnospiraceae bacterium]